MFSGDNKEWEEFTSKLKGQVAANSYKVNDIIEYVEAKVSEGAWVCACSLTYSAACAAVEYLGAVCLVR